MAAVVVQERSRLLREGIASVLDAEPDLTVVGCVANSRELTKLCAERRPDIVVLEVPADGHESAWLALGLRRRSPGVRLVGLIDRPTTADEPPGDNAGQVMDSVVARQAGAAELLLPVKAARTTRARTCGRARVPVTRPDQPTLTYREREVLQLVALGLTVGDISARLGITPKTVDGHKQRIFAKLGVQNQAHAVALATRSGWLRAPVDESSVAEAMAPAG